MKNILLLSCGVALLFCSCKSKRRVDLLIHHAVVYTVDSAFTKAEAVAVKDGKIVAVGGDADMLAVYKADSVVDAGGHAVYPGFIDAHAHFVGYGRTLFEVNLYDCRTWDEAIQRVTTFAAAHPGERWIRGRGWDQNKFPAKAYPDNKRLNELFPDKPVLLNRVDGHAAIANATALAMADIHPGQRLDGGTITSENGALTGLLIDNAVDLVNKVIPRSGLAEYERWLTAAQRNCFAQGLTTITDCGLSAYDIDMIDTLQRSGKLLTRLYVMLSDDKDNLDRCLSKGPYKTERLYVKGVKAYADGALGSRGACLLRPYDDQPGWTGFLLRETEHYDSLAALLANTDFQMCTHAIGDSGCRMVLNVYNKYLHGRNDKRWRIEHAQVVAPEDFNLFGAASVIPSVQPTHATSDMYWAAERVGAERLKGAYAYKRLLAQNGWLPLGTDFPVEDISPFKTFYAAVARKDSKGFPAGGFQPENALTREQALRGMTIWAAKADCMELEVGSIEPGKKADLVILDKDLLKADEKDLLQTKVIATYSNGQKVY